MKKLSLPPGLIQKTKKFSLYIFFSGVALVGLFLFAVFGTLMAFPPERYRPQIETTLRQALEAESVKIDSITLDASLKSVSLGFVIGNLEIKGGNGIRLIQVPKTQVHVKPLKIFLGKVPLDVQVHNPNVVLEDFGKKSGSVPSPEKHEGAGPTPAAYAKIEKYAKFVNLSFSVKNAQIDMEGLLAASPAGPRSVVKLEKSNVDGNISGSNGKISLRCHSELNIDLEQGKMLLQGPASLDFSGQLKMEGGRPQDIEVEDLNLNLDETNIGSLGWIEKTSRAPFEIALHGNLRLPEGDQTLAYKFPTNTIDYGPIKIGFSLSSTENGSFFLKWNIPKTDLAGVNLPLSSFRDVPIKGAVEFSGDYKTHPSGDQVGSWRVSLNNILLPAPNLPGLNEKTSQGNIVFSFISQGSYNNGLVTSPGSEMQISATAAQFEEKKWGLMKAAGDKAEFLLKASVDEDRLDFKRIMLDLHTLSVTGRATLNKLSAFLKGEGAPFQLQIASNRVDLSNWGSYFPAFRRQPTLEGFFEFKGNLDGELKYGEKFWKGMGWNIDRFNLTNVQGRLDRSAWAGTQTDHSWSVLGPFKGTFLLKGRGKGTTVDRAEVLSTVNLDSARVLYKDSFEKREKIPLSLNLILDQTRERFQIREGNLTFHDLDLGFQGSLIQGSRMNSIALTMNKPIDFSNWNEFLRKKSSSPLKGFAQWKGRLMFPTDASLTQTNFDWKKFRIDGQLDLKDIQFKNVGMQDPISNLNAKILFGARSVTVPKASFRSGVSNVALSGEIENLNSKNGSTIWQWMNNKSWKVESQIQVDKMKVAENDSPAPRKKELSLKEIKEYFESPYLKESQVLVALRLGQGQFGKIPFSNLNARLLWDKDIVRLQPFSVQSLDGKLSGSTVFNLKDYYNRKDDPTVTATLKSEGLDLQKLAQHVKPAMASTFGGRLNGDVVVASKGFLPADILANSKGRLAGQIQKGYFDSLRVLQDSFQGLSQNEKFANFLAAKVGNSPCIDKVFTADVDAQINGGQVTVDSGNLRFASKTEVLLTGVIGSDLALNMKGDILPSSSCLKPDTLRCLQNLEGKAALPYTLTGYASDAKAQIAYTDLGRRIASCATEKLRAKATEAVKEKSKEVEQQAKDQVKKLFKGL